MPEIYRLHTQKYILEAAAARELATLG